MTKQEYIAKFKRTEILTELERQAAFTLDEVLAFYAKHESEKSE